MTLPEGLTHSEHVANRLRTKFMVMDSAMGTELDARGIDTSLPLWSARAMLTAPTAVQAIHRDHLAAGADVITTNTFRTTARTLGRAGYNAATAAELTTLAVAVARRARDEAGTSAALIAGSIAPLEDCYSPALTPPEDVCRAEHAVQAAQLAAAGADFILIETMPTVREAVAAATVAAACGLQVAVGFTSRLAPDGTPLILDGTTLPAAVAALAGVPVSMVMVNCAAPEVIHAGIVALRTVTAIGIGAYANLGAVESVSGWAAATDVTSEHYAAAARDWLTAGATMVGGCCGTTVNQIAALRPIVDAWRRAVPSGWG